MLRRTGHHLNPIKPDTMQLQQHSHITNIKPPFPLYLPTLPINNYYQPNNSTNPITNSYLLNTNPLFPSIRYALGNMIDESDLR